MGKKLKVLIGIIGFFVILAILAGSHDKTSSESEGGQEITTPTEHPVSYEYYGAAIDLVKKGLSKTPEDFKLRFNENATFKDFLKLLGFEQIVLGLQKIEQPSGIIEISSGEGLTVGEAVHLVVIKFDNPDSAATFYNQLESVLDELINKCEETRDCKRLDLNIKSDHISYSRDISFIGGAYVTIGVIGNIVYLVKHNGYYPLDKNIDEAVANGVIEGVTLGH